MCDSENCNCGSFGNEQGARQRRHAPGRHSHDHDDGTAHDHVHSHEHSHDHSHDHAHSHDRAHDHHHDHDHEPGEGHPHEAHAAGPRGHGCHCLPPHGIAEVGEAKVDLDRTRRCGFPEVVFAEGKSVPTIEKIFHALIQSGADVLATRVSAEQAEALVAAFPAGRYNAVGRTFRIAKDAAECGATDVQSVSPRLLRGRVTIVTAGTCDLPVAEEARETALWAGADVTMVCDAGVAGPHRLAASLPAIEQADVVVVVAGMEGALPSVVGGYVACPVIAVPTSVGYGASFGGVAALLSMLNSCAANVAVVNIDAGFKGGYLAGMIAQNAAKARQSANT